MTMPYGRRSLGVRHHPLCRTTHYVHNVAHLNPLVLAVGRWRTAPTPHAVRHRPPHRGATERLTCKKTPAKTAGHEVARPAPKTVQSYEKECKLHSHTPSAAVLPHAYTAATTAQRKNIYRNTRTASCITIAKKNVSLHLPLGRIHNT